MGNSESVAETAAQQLESGSPIVLVSLVDLEGSTPRHGGARMIVGEDGKSHGTVGGGLLEAAAITASRQALASKQSKMMSFSLDGNGTDGKMMCGGNASVLVDVVPPTNENADLFRTYDSLVQNAKDFYFLTVFNNDQHGLVVLGHSLLRRDGTSSGTYAWTDDELDTLKSELHNISSASILSLGAKDVLIDPITKTRTVYCFGAGHVAIPTAHIAALAGFRVVVVDDRSEFANAQRFPDATQVVVPESFEGALENLPIDADSFIVIITRGHRYDRVVLEQALKTNASYIGMIGSLRKRDAIYSALLEEGVSAEDIKRVHSPIGLPTEAETPEEIAVSIVAEMIAERAKQQR